MYHITYTYYPLGLSPFRWPFKQIAINSEINLKLLESLTVNAEYIIRKNDKTKQLWHALFVLLIIGSYRTKINGLVADTKTPSIYLL